jgi:very-short-patch-repair endonuclease
MRLDNQINALAAEQHSCVATWQLRDLGATWTEIGRLRRSSRWCSQGHDVLVLVGTPPSDLRSALVAVLTSGPGSALSHRSAAALWGIGASYRLLPAHVFRTHDEAEPIGALGTVHQQRSIGDRWLTRFKGLPVVRPELCIYQLCASVAPGRAERALDRAWSMGLVSGRSMQACLTELARRGRNGTSVLRGLLADRAEDHVPPASGLESRFQEIARGFGFSRFRRQVDLGDELDWVGRVDFVDDVDRLVIEIQSEAFHAALSYRRDDSDRRAKHQAAGYTVVEIWDSTVWAEPDVVRQRLLEARARARRVA